MSKQINNICKILKVSKGNLKNLKRNNCDKWDSLAHLEIMFINKIH